MEEENHRDPAGPKKKGICDRFLEANFLANCFDQNISIFQPFLRHQKLRSSMDLHEKKPVIPQVLRMKITDSWGYENPLVWGLVRALFLGEGVALEGGVP